MLFEIFNWHSESLVFPHPTQKWSEVKKFQLRLLQHCKASFYLQPQGTQPSSLWPMTHVDHDSTTLDGHTTIHRIRRKDDSMKRLRYAKQAYIRWIKLGVCTSAVENSKLTAVSLFSYKVSLSVKLFNSTRMDVLERKACWHGPHTLGLDDDDDNL